MILPVASIRFARTNSFSEAFNIHEIIEHTGKIGWINYIIALILITLVIAIPVAILVSGFILLAGSYFSCSKSDNLNLRLCHRTVYHHHYPGSSFVIFQAVTTRLYDGAKPDNNFSGK
jgi:hypothetical protein